MRNTKEIILNQSLRLFSIKGYDGVSVRDIAREVGVRESAIYKHYKSKMDIFDSILSEMQRRYDEANISFHIPQGTVSNMADEFGSLYVDELKRISKNTFYYWMKDEYASQFYRMLNIEQYKNSEAGGKYRSFFIDTILNFQEELFREMIKRGYFREADPQIMAIHFYAPFFLMFTKYGNDESCEDEITDMIDRHVEQFAHLYAVK